MLNSSRIIALISIVFCLSFSYGQNQQSIENKLRVGLYESPPFVMDVDEKPKGMAVELWEEIAKNKNISFEYFKYNSPNDLVDGIENSEIDIAVTNLTITKQRAERIDFSQPWFDGGLRIMISQNHESSGSDIFEGLKDAGHIRAYLWIIGVIIFFTVGLTLFDRRFDKDFSKRWREGLAESFYTVMSVAISGKLSQKIFLDG